VSRQKAAGDEQKAEALYDEAAQYWMEAIRIAPNNYIEAQNWLKNTGRMKVDIFY
jgi:deoxyribose-phosphate aldolase